MKHFSFISLVAMASAAASFGQTATMPPHAVTYTGETRGYYFTARTSFMITGVKVLLPTTGTGSTNTFQNFAIVRFDSSAPPPPFSATSAAGMHDVFSEGGFNVSRVEFTYEIGGLGTNYCGSGVVNSTGMSGEIWAMGSLFASSNDVTLVADNLPNNAFGYFLTSRTQGMILQPGGSLGILCLGGGIGRYVGPGQIQSTGTAGSFDIALDLTQTPTPTGFVSVVAGERWNFTTWHRDSVGGVAVSNFTNGLEIAFQ